MQSISLLIIGKVGRVLARVVMLVLVGPHHDAVVAANDYRVSVSLRTEYKFLPGTHLYHDSVKRRMERAR